MLNLYKFVSSYMVKMWNYNKNNNKSEKSNRLMMYFFKKENNFSKPYKNPSTIK